MSNGDWQMSIAECRFVNEIAFASQFWSWTFDLGLWTFSLRLLTFDVYESDRLKLRPRRRNWDSKAGGDVAIFPLISSANIACGFHAGDPQVMRHSVSLALRHGVSIGAHPGTHDLQGFGRRAMDLSTEEVENLLLYQIGALDAFARAAGGRIRHVKPHGWLYNEAAKNAKFAQIIASTVRSLNPEWILFGAAGSQLIAAAKDARLPFAEEAFADRTYEIDGSLTPRSQPGSLITDPAQAARQCLDVVLKGKLKTTKRGGDFPSCRHDLHSWRQSFGITDPEMYQGRTLSKWIPNPSCRRSLTVLPEISQKLRAVFWGADFRLTAYVFAPTAASQSSALFLSCSFRRVCRRSCASNLCHAQTLFSRTYPSLIQTH